MSHKGKKITILLVTTIIMIIICSFAAIEMDSDSNVRLAEIELSDGSIIKPWYNEKDAIYYYFLPSYAKLDEACFLLGGKELEFRGQKIKDGDSLDRLVYGIEYRITNLSDHTSSSIKILKSQNVSSMYVSTATGSMKEVFQSKNHKELAHITVIDKNGKIDTFITDSVIKGRGNVTWEKDKKPLAIQFNEPLSILGMGESTKYVLLANAMDYSNMRSKLIYDIAKEVGATGVPDCEYLDLYLNGEYYGLYMICQSPENWYERERISADGLYLFTAEIPDRLSRTNHAIYVQNKQSLVDVCLPKKLSEEEKKTAENIVLTLDEMVLSGNVNIWKTFDLDSWVKRYLIDEVFENFDSGVTSSYFYISTKAEDNMVYAGPLWDYDNTIENWHNYSWPTKNPETLYAKNDNLRTTYGRRVLWYSSLYDNPVFYERMTQIFEKQFIPAIEDMLENRIFDLHKEIAVANENNYIRWGINSELELEHIVDYMTRRLNFLKSIWLEDKEYCLVRAAKPLEVNSYYNWFYVERGHAISESDYFEIMLGDSDWFYEDTGEHFDPNSPIFSDTYISNVGNESDVLKIIVYKLKLEKKMAFIAASVILLLFCGIVFWGYETFGKGI